MRRTLHASVVQANRGFSVPATSDSSSGGGAEAFPDITGERQGFRSPPNPGGDYGITSTTRTTNPATSPYGPNTTSGYVPNPKPNRAFRRYAYGLSMTPLGNIRPNPYKGYVTKAGTGELRGVRLKEPGGRPFRFTDDGGDAGGVGSGAGYGLTTGWPLRPQSNFNPYARVRQDLGTDFWSNNVAGDAANMQAAFGQPPSGGRPFRRQYTFDTGSALEGAAIGVVVGTVFLAPLIFTAFGRSLVRRGAGKVRSRVESYAHTHTK